MAECEWLASGQWFRVRVRLGLGSGPRAHRDRAGGAGMRPRVFTNELTGEVNIGRSYYRLDNRVFNV